MNRDFLFSLLGFVVSAVGLLILGIGAFFVFSMLGPGKHDVYGVEKWTCAKEGSYSHELAWISKAGSADIWIMLDGPGQIEFFALSCIPAKERGCTFTDKGWGSVYIEVDEPSGMQTMAFDRKDKDVDESYRHHATVYGYLAEAIISSFRAGATARITAKGPKGEVIHVTKVNLAGFAPALDKCAAAWAAEAKQKKD